MNILYGFSNCSDRKYGEIFSGKKVAVLQPDQKYHGLLIKGLSKCGEKVTCLSGLPINRNVTKKLFIREKDETEDGVFYHYYNTINFPVLRQLGIYLKARRSLKKFYAHGEKTVILCDCLNIANSYGLVSAAKKRKIPVVMIVTDLPEFMSGGTTRKINEKLFALADGFIFLTEQMNAKVNKLNKPYIVLEGHSDSSIVPIERKNREEYKTGKKTVIYAGSIVKLYGIKNLVEGFIKANIIDAELKIFGDGDYREELTETAKNHKNVLYMGIKSNGEIVDEEKKAALLVNPRPSDPEYTKYSFPSKNMEYMASATPVLTTVLPGMPKEYLDYVFTIKNETAEGIAEALKEVLSLSKEIRYDLGDKAAKFVKENKSNVIQAKKIKKFLEEEIC